MLGFDWPIPCKTHLKNLNVTLFEYNQCVRFSHTRTVQQWQSPLLKTGKKCIFK